MMALLSGVGHRRKRDGHRLAAEAVSQAEFQRLQGEVARLDAENDQLARALLNTTEDRRRDRAEADERLIEHAREVQRLTEDNRALRARLAEAHPVHQAATVGEDTVEMERPLAGPVLAVEPLPAKPVEVIPLAARFIAGATAGRRNSP